MSSTEPTEPEPSATDPSEPDPSVNSPAAVAWLIWIGIVIFLCAAAAVRGGNVLLLLGIAAGISAIVAAIHEIVIRTMDRQLENIAALAPGQQVFRFQSNSWFQSAIVLLREHELIDSTVLTDSEQPTNGPRWASASATAITFWRGYSTTPYFTIPWKSVSRMFAETERHRGGRGGNMFFPGISLIIEGGPNPINMILRMPVARGSRPGRPAGVTWILAQLEQLRGVNPNVG